MVMWEEEKYMQIQSVFIMPESYTNTCIKHISAGRNKTLSFSSYRFSFEKEKFLKQDSKCLEYKNYLVSSTNSISI